MVMTDIVKWDPLRDMTRFFEEVDKLMANFFNSFPAELFTPRMTGNDLNVQVQEKGGEVVITADIPESMKDNVDVAIHQGHLIISGEGKSHLDHGNTRGFHWNRFTRQQPLPARVKSEKASVDLKNGKLTIRAPKE